MVDTGNFDKYANFIKRCIDITSLSKSEAGVLNTGRRGKQGKMNSQGTSQTTLDKMSRWHIARERKVIGSIDLEGLLRRAATYNFDVVSTSILMRKLETEKSSVKGAESAMAKKTLELSSLTGDLAIAKQVEISRIREDIALFTATIAQLDSEIKEKSMNRKQCQETAVTCFRILACEGDYSSKDADALLATIKAKTSRVGQIHGFAVSSLPVKSSVGSVHTSERASGRASDRMREEDQSKHVDSGTWRRAGTESSEFRDSGFHSKSKFGDGRDSRDSRNTISQPRDSKMSSSTHSSEFGSSRSGGGSKFRENTDGWTNVESSKKNNSHTNSRIDSRGEIKFSSSSGNRFKDLDDQDTSRPVTKDGSYIPPNMRGSMSSSSNQKVSQSVEHIDEFPELVSGIKTGTTKSISAVSAWSKGVSDAVKASIAIVIEDDDIDDYQVPDYSSTYGFSQLGGYVGTSSRLVRQPIQPIQPEQLDQPWQTPLKLTLSKPIDGDYLWDENDDVSDQKEYFEYTNEEAEISSDVESDGW